MIIYLHASELSDTGATYGRHIESEVIQIIIPPGTMPGDLAEVVNRRISESERIALTGNVELLLINTHGSPGEMHLGGLAREEADINIHNYQSLTSIFRPFFKPISEGGRGVEIHGCGVAASSLMPHCIESGCNEIDDPDVGFRFVYALANGFNTRVRASTFSEQVPDFDGLFEHDPEHRDGDLIEAVPGDDADWHGHVIHARVAGLEHPGGSATRRRAMFSPPPILHDLRTGRRLPPVTRDEDMRGVPWF